MVRRSEVPLGGKPTLDTLRLGHGSLQSLQHTCFFFGGGEGVDLPQCIHVQGFGSKARLLAKRVAHLQFLLIGRSIFLRAEDTAVHEDRRGNFNLNPRP